MAVFGPPDVAKLEAMGKVDGLVRAAKYKKDPAVQAEARRALTGLHGQDHPAAADQEPRAAGHVAWALVHHRTSPPATASSSSYQ